MFNLSEGFDFNVALENDTIDTLSNNLVYTSMISGIEKIFKKYNFKNNNNNIFVMDINETLTDITLGGLLGNNGKINICKDIINYSKE